MSAVVLAYHEMGWVCLNTLLEHGVQVQAVFTHEDASGENCWFRSVAALAADAGIETHTPEDINQPEWVERIRELAPDALFSFHYRRLVKRAIRRIPRHGCVNLHASLLPRYRGRCPLNWQLVHGEEVSGVTLHRMVARADAGDIIDQEQVAVDPDDTALTLYQRLLPAASRVLARRADEVLRGEAPRRPQDEAQATTFGGRGPEDGRIDWRWPAKRIHDLVRAVAKPWPGAFCDTPEGRVMVWRTGRCQPDTQAPALEPGEVWSDAAGRTLIQTGAGLLELLELETPSGAPPRAGDRLQESTK